MLDFPLAPPVAARLLAMIVLGGKGSGNFGHAGRPGLVGGSSDGPADRSGEVSDSYGSAPQSGWDAMTIDERRASTSFTRDKAFRSFGTTEHQRVIVTAPGGIEIAITTKYGSIEKQEERLKNFGINNPREFLQDFALMTSGVSREGVISIINSNATTFTLAFRAPGIKMKRKFSLEDGVLQVEHALFTLENDKQGSGIGARMLVDSLDMYAKHGVEEVAMTANIDIGGYAWARLGFRAADPDEFRDMVTNRLDVNSTNEGRQAEIIREVIARQQGAPEWLSLQPEGKSLLKGSSWQAVINMGVNGHRLRTQLRDKIAKNKAKWAKVSK